MAIDDLLKFSRLGRASMTVETVHTMAMVAAVVEELRQEMNFGHARVTIHPLADCTADQALLRQVWINLISNAFKYSRNCGTPEIEIGCRTTAGTTDYYVRDNGTGFDMRYAGKLFGVFQRLHRAEEYEGTGVGLALVQRIVHRHGGKIQAEAEPGKGATFSFTLEPASLP